MTRVFKCKEFRTREEAREEGAAWMRIAMDAKLNYGVKETATGFELRVSLDYPNKHDANLESDGFRPCSATP